MKIKKEVIDKFRRMCRDEENTSTEDVQFKLTRNFELGEYVCKGRVEESVVRAFGTLYMRCEKGVITDIYRGRYYPVNKQAKKDYTYCHRMGWI